MKISVTGHRDCDSVWTEVMDVMSVLLGKFNPEIVNTGMAIGFDQLVALSCIEARVPFKAFVPFKGQETKWLAKQQYVYQSILFMAKDVEIVSPGSYEAWKMHARNTRLVEEADLMIAYLDPTQTYGGTYACVQTANQKKVPIVNVYTLVQKYASCASPEDRIAFLSKLKSKV